MKTQAGAELKLNAAPFPEALALFHAFLEEAKGVEVTGGKGGLPNVLKNVFCAAFSSPKLNAALETCMQRCTYNGKKIVLDLFEDPKAREDYLEVCYLVAEENLRPFTKSLYAKFEELLERLSKLPA